MAWADMKAQTRSEGQYKHSLTQRVCEEVKMFGQSQEKFCGSLFVVVHNDVNLSQPSKRAKRVHQLSKRHSIRNISKSQSISNSII